MKTHKWRDIKRPGNPHMEQGYTVAALATMTLCDLRDEARLTQAALAERLGVSQSWIAQIEGETDMRLSTIAAYVAALGGQLRIAAELPNGQTIALDRPFEPAPVQTLDTAI
jgi:transcriptional regulator with XRE-family HTH domain